MAGGEKKKKPTPTTKKQTTKRGEKEKGSLCISSVKAYPCETQS